MQYRYSLDKSKKKYHCPQCKEKRFVLYIDNTENEPLQRFVGRCDKETNCGYHYTPKQFFRDYPQAKDKPSYEVMEKPSFPPKTVQQELVTGFSTFPYSLVEKSLQAQESNHFISYLLSVFSFDKVQRAVNDYCIGTSKRWAGATVFWQIDADNHVRTGKILLYNVNTGKRVKYQNIPLIDFVHSVLLRKKLIDNFTLKQSPFGLHLLTVYPQKTVAAVESEKTAVIMSMILPEYMWISYGGLNNMIQLAIPILKDRKIVVFPDAGTYDKVNTKIAQLSANGYNISVSDLLEKRATDAEKKSGLDLADYAITNEWNKETISTTFNEMRLVNPQINILAYKFKCKEMIN